LITRQANTPPYRTTVATRLNQDDLSRFVRVVVFVFASTSVILLVGCCSSLSTPFFYYQCSGHASRTWLEGLQPVYLELANGCYLTHSLPLLVHTTPPCFCSSLLRFAARQSQQCD
jgi:hypothetical protein